MASKLDVASGPSIRFWAVWHGRSSKSDLAGLLFNVMAFSSRRYCLTSRRNGPYVANPMALWARSRLWKAPTRALPHFPMDRRRPFCALGCRLSRRCLHHRRTQDGRHKRACHLWEKIGRRRSIPNSAPEFSPKGDMLAYEGDLLTVGGPVGGPDVRFEFPWSATRDRHARQRAPTIFHRHPETRAADGHSKFA